MTTVDIINAKIKELTEIICDGKPRKVAEVKSIQNTIALLEAERARLLREPSRMRRIALRLRLVRPR